MVLISQGEDLWLDSLSGEPTVSDGEMMENRLHVVVRALHAPVIGGGGSGRRRRWWFVFGCLRGLVSSGGEHGETTYLSPEPGSADDGRYSTCTTHDRCCYDHCL